MTEHDYKELQLSEAEIDQQLNEIFDTEGQKYPVSNLTPKAKVPHMLLMELPGAENLVVRFCNYAVKGDQVKQVKPGDKFMQVQVMNMSPKGNLQVLKTGLGSDPIAAMNMICDATLDVMKTHHMDAALVRFPTKGLKGAGRQVARIGARILQKRGAGQFMVLPEMLEYQGKYTYILAYRKSRGITGVAQMQIDPEMYEISKTKVGDVVICKKTGDKVTKGEAIAGSMAAHEDKRSLQSATKAKVDASALIRAFTTKVNIDDDPAKEFVPVETIHDYEPEKNVIIENASAVFASSYPPATAASLERNGIRGDVAQMFAARLPRQTPINSTDALEIFAQASIDVQRPAMYNHAAKNFEYMEDGAPKRAAMDTFVNSMMEQQLKKDMHSFQEMIEGKFNREYRSVVGSYLGKAGPDAREAVERYCGSDYEYTNAVFIEGNEIDDEARDIIEGLDHAFKVASVKIPASMTLYRGMKCNEFVSKAAIANKKFYFSNYVSTSAKPIMFSGQLGSTSTFKMHSKEDEVAPEAIELKDGSASPAFFGFAITETHVPAIFPGEFSDHIDECEFILPRGTVFEFTKVYNAGEAFMFKNFFVTCKAVKLSSLNESEVVYDGDHLMETGEVVQLGFKAFTESGVEPTPISSVSRTEAGMMMIKVMSPEGVSEKFIQTI